MKSPADWTESDVISLINLGEEEGSALEFKRAESLDPSEKNKTEISKDVSAFANSAGGTIVYGIAESKSKPPAQKLSVRLTPRNTQTNGWTKLLTVGYGHAFPASSSIQSP